MSTPVNARRIAVTLYGYAFLDDFVLLYPLYALLFSQSGLSVWQISSLFAIWSATSVLLEVPSGAWADAVSRRLLLWIGPLLSAAGFALWTSVTSYWAFAVGFVLWGVKGALTSGALEALVYDELDRLGDADRYARIMGRAKAVGTVGTVLAMGVAAPVLADGGYLAVGAASVAACLLTAVVAASFPEHRRRSGAPVDSAVPGRHPEVGTPAAPGQLASTGRVEVAERDEAEEDDLGWADTLRAGVAEVRHRPPVRAALVLVVLVTSVWGALDEYTPLLISATGVPDVTVPLLLLVIWATVAVGGLVTGPAERLRTPGFAALLVGAATAMAVGALSGRAVGVVAVAVAFGAFQVADVVAGARLQHRLTGRARATVTSLAGMATDVTTIGVFGLYPVLAGAGGHGGAFAVLALPYAVVALWTLRSRAR